MDVEARADIAAAEKAAQAIKAKFLAAGDDISKSFGSQLSRMFSAFDGSAARNALSGIRDEFSRTAAAEADAARIMVRANNDIEVSTRRLAEVTARYGETSSQAARVEGALADARARSAVATRTHVDAMVASEAAAGRMAGATDTAATSTSNFGRVANAIGITSVGALGLAMVETTRKAGDFEQSMTKLSASADLPANQIKAVSDGILQMAGKVGYSAGELTDAMYTVQKAGLNGANGAATAAEKLQVLQAAAQGASVEQAPLADVINALTTSLTDFHVPASQAAQVMSQMVTAVGESKVPLQDFAGALHSIEPAAAAAHLQLQDVWGVLAQITQSGTSADQAADQINNALRSLSGANAPASAAMQQLGISADDVSQKLSQRGLAGTMQYLSDTVMTKFAGQNNINAGELRNAAQAQQNSNEMLNQMSPAARQASEALAKGTEGHREYQLAIRGANEQDAQRMKQFQTLTDQVDGFSTRFAKGRETLETYNQAMNEITGTQSGAQIAFQTTGQNADETNKRIQDIATTYTNADGTVKGFNETQDTLNAKQRDAKAAFGAAAIELGEVFVPAMKEVADVAKTVADFLAEHKTLAEGLVDTLGVLAGAWAAWKALMVFDKVLTGLEGVVNWVRQASTEQQGLNTVTQTGNAAMGTERAAAAATGEAGVAAATAAEVTDEEAVTAAAADADAAAAGGAGAGGKGSRFTRGLRSAGTGLPIVGGFLAAQQAINPDLGHDIDPDQHNWQRVVFGKAGDLFGGHAAGGAIYGRGAKGRDSVPIMAAPGEHMLTAHEVDMAGGHKGVERLRAGIRAGLVRGYDQGGPIDPTDPLQQINQFRPTPSGSASVNTPPPAVLTGLGSMWDKVSGGVKSFFTDPGRFHKMQIDPNQRGIADQPTPIGPMSRQTFDDLKGNDDNASALDTIQGTFGPAASVPSNLVRGSWFGNRGWPEPAGGGTSTPTGSGGGGGGGIPNTGMDASPGPGNFGDALDSTSQMGGYGAASSPISGMDFSGGNAGQVMSMAQAASRMPYLWGGFGPGGFDCSGLAAALANTATTGNWQTGGRFTTANEGSELAKRGFKPGAGGLGALTIGWNDTHTGITLPDGTHIDAEDEKDGIVMGRGSRGATGFPNVMHFDMPGGAPITALDMGAGGAGGMPSLTGGRGAGLSGAMGTGGIGSGGSRGGGGPLQELVRVMSTFLAELAMGNPYGQLQAMGRGGGTGLTGGVGPPDQRKIDTAQNRVDTLNREIAVLEQKKTEETAKTKQSEKMNIEGELAQKRGELDQANQHLAMAQQPVMQRATRTRGGIPSGIPFSGLIPGLGPQAMGPTPIGGGLGGGLVPAAGQGVGGAPGLVSPTSFGGPAGGLSPTGGPSAAGGPVGPAPGQGRSKGEGKGFSPSIGSAIGGAAASLGMPGAAQAGKLADRTAGYIGQAASILGVEAPLEIFGLNDTALADPSKTPLGKLAFGLAGAHHDSPNTAGQTAPPLQSPDQKQQQGQGTQGTGQGGDPNQQIGVNVQGDMHVHTNDADSFHQDMQQQSQMAGGQYPSNTR